MSANQRFNPLPDFPFQAAENSEELTHGVYLKALHCRISATVDIAAGGGNDGTLVNEGVQRLLTNVRMVWDGFNIIDNINGRELVAIARRASSQPLTETQIAAVGIQTTAVEINFIIPFARPWLVDPFNTVFPPVKVDQQLRVYAQWEQGLANAQAGTVAGSGAFETGGDRVITFTVAPTLQITEEYAVRGTDPWMIPVISNFESEQFTAANARLRADLLNDRPFTDVLIQVRQGASQEGQAGLNFLSLITGGTRHVDNVPFAILKRIERDLFPAVPVATAALDNGFLWLPLTSGGKLGNVFDPAQLPKARFEMDVAAPTGAPGVVRFTMLELMSMDGVTLL